MHECLSFYINLRLKIAYKRVNSFLKNFQNLELLSTNYSAETVGPVNSVTAKAEQNITFPNLLVKEHFIANATVNPGIGEKDSVCLKFRLRQRGQRFTQVN